MTDKELIKQELKRRISNLEQLGDRKYIEKYFTEQFRFIEVYEGLIKFIDSLDSIAEDSFCDTNCTTKSEDLEEYYKKEFLYNEWFAKSGQRTISEFNFFTAKHFAEWQKRQMMKDAKDAWVNTYESPDGRYYAEFVIDEPPANYRGKKNAKIIIVKVK